MRLLSVLLVAVFLAGCFGGTPPADDGSGGEPAPELVPFYGVILETDLGNVTIVLYPRYAPQTVANFQRLVDEGYYDGKPFHRVIDDFVIQTGEGDDPKTVPLETHEDAYFSAGALGIARDADPGSGGPQFFITDHAQPHLKWPNGTASESYGAFTMFGQVVHGMDVVRQIAAVPTLPGLDKPVEDVLIRRATTLNVNLTPDEADRLPLRTTDRQVKDGYRMSFEFPANLAAGDAADVTWYVSPREAPATGPLAAPRMEAVSPEGDVVPVELTPDEVDPGVLRATVTLPGEGSWFVRLLDGDTRMAGFTVKVAPSPDADAE